MARTSPVQWELGPNGVDRPFLVGTADGRKHYLSPAAMAGDTDPRSTAFIKANPTPSGGFLHSGGQWNDQTGKMEQPINWGNLLSVGVGGALAAPFVLPALGVGGGAGAGATGVAGAGAVGVPASLAAPTVAATGGMATGLGTIGVPAALSSAGMPAAVTTAASAPGWADLLKTGGQMLTSGAKASADQDLANNTNATNYLRALDEDYKTKLSASTNVPAGLQRQALWSSFLQGAKTSDPNKPATDLMSPDQQILIATQKAAILKKLADANTMSLPTAPIVPSYQQPGPWTKAASTLGTIGQVAGMVPWKKILSQ